MSGAAPESIAQDQGLTVADVIADLQDVPSPIDFCCMEEAEAWAEAAAHKRPCRETFFEKFVEELARVRAASVLELGSGPGFLSQRVLRDLPHVNYTALDLSPAMHALARMRLGSAATRVRFVEADFRSAAWGEALEPRYHAIVTLQAVHELRHKRRAVSLYRAVRDRLAPEGVFLMCDHFRGEGGMAEPRLYMTPAEQEQALHDGGFRSADLVHREGGLVLYRGRA
jgi:SAM-dependent methyltransferase